MFSELSHGKHGHPLAPLRTPLKAPLKRLRGAGALQARHGQRLVADHVLRSQAQALVGSPGAQQAAGQTCCATKVENGDGFVERFIE